MEKGSRFSEDWPEERDGPGPKSDGPERSGDRKRKKRKAADSSQSRDTTESKPDKPERPENKRVGHVVAESFLKRDSATGPAEERQRKKKEVEKPELPAEKAEEQQTPDHAVEPAQEAGSESKRLEHSAAEAATADSVEEKAHSDSEAQEVKGSDETALWEEVVVPLDILNGGEVGLRLPGNKPVAEHEIKLNASPEPEPKAEAVTDPVVGAEANSDSESDVVPGPTATPEAPYAQPEQQPLTPGHAPNSLSPAPERPAAESYEAPSSEVSDPVEAATGPETAVPYEPLEQPVEPAMVLVSAEHRPEPAAAYSQYIEHGMVEGDGSAEPMVTKREADDAAYYAAKTAQSRGFVSGLFVAGLWGHFRRKGLKRQFNKLFKKQDKEIQNIKKDQHFYYAEQAQRQAESDRKLVAAERRTGDVESQLTARDRLEKQRLSQEAAVQQRVEAKQSEPEGSEQLGIPPGHRLENSAWHTIEVDARTGRPVENPAFVYGHEYYSERSHEVSPAAQRKVVAGEVALAGATGAISPGGSDDSSNGQDAGGAVPPPYIPSATRQGPPTSAHQKQSDTDDSSSDTPRAARPIWPYVIALLVIFICLIALLH